MVYLFTYKVWMKSGLAHVWHFVEFREETKSIEIDFFNEGNIIHHVIYTNNNPIDIAIFEKYNFDFEVL